ncbi:MAG TPA: hypothetical protein VHW23_05670 [Kofleriaceae bacterium]|jgi:hypothetical protein|nr:hypothetical protein [Kofleriaceae bacterium]
MARGCAIALVTGMAALGACGRIDFAAVPDAGSVLDPAPDAASGAPPPRVAYVGPFVQRDGSARATDTFTAQAHAAGNAIVIQVSCGATAIPTAVSVAAAGWSFTQLGPITASARSAQRSATFAAIAPDTVGVTVTVTWTGSTCNTSSNQIGDEFAMTDPAGGMITFDGFNATQGTGNCTGSVTTGHEGDAVWAACNTQTSVTAIGTGFVKGADDDVGDWTEYALTSHAAGTAEAVEFDNPNVGYVLSMVTLKPR